MYVKIVQRYDKFCFNLPENQNYDRKKTERAINRKRAGCLNNNCTQIDMNPLLVTRYYLTNCIKYVSSKPSEVLNHDFNTPASL